MNVLVARVEEWPSISMIKAVLDGEPICGTWFNRTVRRPLQGPG